MLDHALEAAAMVKGKTRADLDKDRQLNLALVRLLEIILSPLIHLPPYILYETAVPQDPLIACLPVASRPQGQNPGPSPQTPYQPTPYHLRPSP